MSRGSHGKQGRLRVAESPRRRGAHHGPESRSAASRLGRLCPGPPQRGRRGHGGRGRDDGGRGLEPEADLAPPAEHWQPSRHPLAQGPAPRLGSSLAGWAVSARQCRHRVGGGARSWRRREKLAEARARASPGWRRRGLSAPCASVDGGRRGPQSAIEAAVEMGDPHPPTRAGGRDKRLG